MPKVISKQFKMDCYKKIKEFIKNNPPMNARKVCEMHGTTYSTMTNLIKSEGLEPIFVAGKSANKDDILIDKYNQVFKLRLKEPYIATQILCAKVEISPKTLNALIKQKGLEPIPKCKTYPQEKLKDKDFCLDLYKRAVKFREERPDVNKNLIAMMCGISEPTLNRIIENYNLPQIAESSEVKRKRVDEPQKPPEPLFGDICPRLYNMAFRAIGGFSGNLSA